MAEETVRSICERKIRRFTPQLEALQSRQEHLSGWGYAEMGYYKGIIETCEYLLDFLDEEEEKGFDIEDSKSIKIKKCFKPKGE